ncbi:hypothetical protein GCM10027422_09100 [Hymenobacter arcticus]
MDSVVTIARLLECEHKHQVTFSSELEEVATCLGEQYPGFDYPAIVAQLANFATEHQLAFDAYTASAWVNNTSFAMEWRTEQESDTSEFVIERALVKQGDRKSALHHRLSLPFRLREKGLVKPILTAFYQQYRLAAIDDIKLNAGKFIGGYFWAKLGFYATEEQAVRAILVGGKLKDISHEILCVWQDIVDTFYEQNPSGTPFPMLLLSNGQEGKTLLKDTSWAGTMDLHNPQHCAIFENYLGLFNV